MKSCVLLLLGTFLFCGLAADEGSACTTFVLGEKNKQVFGRNYSDAALDRLADFPDSMTCNP